MDQNRLSRTALTSRALGINPRALGISPRDLSGKTTAEIADQLRVAAFTLLAAADAIEEKIAGGVQ